jgi:hypothetical protein
MAFILRALPSLPGAVEFHAAFCTTSPSLTALRRTLPKAVRAAVWTRGERLGEPARPRVLGVEECVSLVVESGEVAAVVAGDSGEPTRRCVVFGNRDLSFDAGEFVGSVGWCVFGDPGVHVGEPWCEHSQRRGPVEGVAEVVERGHLGSGTGEHTRQGLPWCKRTGLVVVVDGEVVGDHERGVVVAAAERALSRR